MPRSHPLKWFGIERILQAAGTFDGRDPAADQLSQAVAKLIPERGLPTGKGEAYWLPRDRHEARALVSSISTAGGDLIAQASVARVVAAARPTTVLEAAGATVVNVPAGNAEYVVPRWHEVSSGGWVSEGEAVPAANFTVATASATPHLCGARLGVSRRLMLQGIEPIEPAVLAELSRTMRSFLEIGYWQGLGSEKQPMGIASLPNTTTETFNASTPTWVEVLSMIDKYLDNHSDFGKATFFAHPALLTELMATPKASSTAAFIAEPGPAPRTAQIAGIPVFTSTAVPSGKLYLMDPTRVNLVRWDAPQLIADRTTAGKSISGAAELIVLDAVDLIVTNPAEVVVGGAAS